MRDLYSDILDTYQRIKSHLKRDSTDPEVEREVREGLSELTTKIARLSDEEAFISHASDVLAREAARRHEGDREEPLCTCGDEGCPVPEGNLPADVRIAMSPYSDGDPVEALKSWIHGHKTDFESVDDFEEWPPRMVLNEWAERHADAFDQASELLALARSG